MLRSKAVFVFLLVVFSKFGNAQQSKALSKIDAQLKYLSNANIERDFQEPALSKQNDIMYVSLILKGNGDVKSLIEKAGGRIYSQLGTIYTADIPLENLLQVAESDLIVKMESSQPVEVYNERGIIHIRADSVQKGFLPDGQKYSGKNVLVGTVDTGIDFLNADFRKQNDSTQTRIVSIWDQTYNQGNPPTNFAYGSAWNASQIQQALLNPDNIGQRDSSGHGTHVTGTSAGLRGVAYNAEIVSVKTPLVSNGDYRFSTSAKTLDAVNYVYQKAAELGKSCVVNMSLGFAFGAPHDGTSLFEQGLDYMVEQRRGFIICASAGNDGGSVGHHGGYPLTADSVWSYVHALNGCTWYGVNERTNDDSMFISIQVDSAIANFSGGGIRTQKTLFQTPWYSITQLKNNPNILSFPVVYANGDTVSTLTITAANYDSTRSEWYIYTRDKSPLLLTSASKVTLYKIAFKGKGIFHSWIQELNGLGVDISSFGGRTNARYKASDDQFTIGIPGTAKNVITVGAFVNKQNYIDLYGRTQRGLNSSNAQPGSLAFFSSVGPTLDGRQKPDFAAPGLNVASSKSRHSPLDSTRMTDLNTIVYSGTSMSCPMTTGAIALLLEQQKFANYSEVKAALTRTAIKDNFTGTVPNKFWGYGKLNIFEAMKSPVTAIEEQYLSAENGLLVYPNPASSKINFELPSTDISRIEVYSLKGEKVFTSTAEINEIDVSAWQSGLYFYRVVIEENQILSGKLIINK